MMMTMMMVMMTEYQPREYNATQTISVF